MNPLDDAIRAAAAWLFDQDEGCGPNALYHPNQPDHFRVEYEAKAAALVAQITPLLTGPLQAQLADPVAVHANMLRGTIAKPSIDQIIHIYGRDALMRAMDAEKMAALTKEFPNV